MRDRETICVLVASMVFMTSAALAQDDSDAFGPQPTGAPVAKARYETNRVTYANNPNILVLPGLVADREAGSVEVLCESTGLQAEEAAEFLLIDKESSHGYEALLWSHAKPSDVRRALIFIGLEPGAPYDPRALRFWADGDLVILDVRVDGEENVIPIEQLIFDTETGDTLPEEGFVFTGSMLVTAPGESGEQVYAADAYDPRSVASIYNEPTAMLDVPRQVNQGEVYGRQVVNSEVYFETGDLLTVIMTPGNTTGKPKKQILQLSVDKGDDGVACRLVGQSGEVLVEAGELTPVMKRLMAMKQQGIAPQLEPTFGDSLPLQSVVKTCAVMAVLESMGIARARPPVEGQLYYRAFVPEKGWATPEGRPTQPWELHLAAKDGSVVGELVWHEPIWSKGSYEPSFKPQAYPAPTPGDVRSIIEEEAKKRAAAKKSPRPAVLLVFAGPSLRYGDVVKFVDPVKSTHGTTYIFLEETL